MTKTAAEWLFDRIVEEWGLDIEERDRAILEQAKEMEKQQIINAYAIGAINGEMVERDLKPKYTNPIQYYNETFKSE